MRILFIANPVTGLYKEIENEMKRQGHEVFTVLDKQLSHDPYSSQGINYPFKKRLWENKVKKYWIGLFASCTKMDKPFDLLFVISGTSVSYFLIEKLKAKNPLLKVVLYTWDGCEHYSFDRHFSYVDKAYTFELKDVQKDTRWILKPIFCNKVNSNESNQTLDLFMVGTSHDGRYSFVKKLLPQLRENRIRYYIRILPDYPKFGIKKIMVLLIQLLSNRSALEELKFSMGMENKELQLHKVLTPKEYNEKLDSAKCVLDDLREGQSGLSARFMWALAAKKKIVTTNKWALSYDFVSSKQVEVISKVTPHLPVDFLMSELVDEECSDVSDFYIDKWVRDILYV